MTMRNDKPKTEQNPYVGARTFEREHSDLFFGREREAFDLLSLVISDRLVLFYAQSGAGKSSLINTRLIPGLHEDGEFRTLPIGRLLRDEVKASATKNIYIYNLLTSLSNLEEDEGKLAELSLSDYIEHLNIADNSSENIQYIYSENAKGNIFTLDDSESIKYVLVIDQFEELFTTYEGEWKKRSDFFSQIATTMSKFPRLWIVLVMREDYIAYLDPFVYLLPGMLRTRYYMQRLSLNQAVEAIEGPAKKRDRIYAPGAAKRLVDALSQVKVLGPNGNWVDSNGQFVEPVQLQVVCSSLWQKLNEGEKEIDNNLVMGHISNIDQALGNFYSERVEAVAREQKVSERDIRQWFDNKLIIDGKRRNMVAQQSAEESSGLDNHVVQKFLGSLIREEKRSGGATYYELTHDRLVEPIIENNKNWFEEYLSPLQKQAVLWNENGRKTGWLFTGDVLREVDSWAREHKNELSELDKEFLEACRKEQQASRRSRNFTILALSLAAFAILSAVLAFGQYQKATVFASGASTQQALAVSNLYLASTAKANAEISANIASTAQVDAQDAANQALAGSLAAQASALNNTNHPLALLLSLEAYQRQPDNILPITNLFQSVQYAPHNRIFGFERVTSVATSPNGTVMAIASGNKITLVNSEDQGILSTITDGTDNIDFRLGDVQTVAFSPDGKTLAIGGCVPPAGSAGCRQNKGQFTLWNVGDPAHPKLLLNSLDDESAAGAHTKRIKTLAFDPTSNSHILATGSYDETIILWRWDVAKKTITELGSPLHEHSSFVNSLSFKTKDGMVLASASDDGTIVLWDVADPSKVKNLGSPELNGDKYVHKAPINSIAFSPDGTQLASASDDKTIILWKYDAKSHSLIYDQTLKGHTGFVRSLAYSEDGNMLASVGFDNSMILWDPKNGQALSLPLLAHTGSINTIAFGKTGSYWLTGSNDGTVVRWNLPDPYQPISQLVNPSNIPEPKTRDVKSPDGKRTASVNLGQPSQFKLDNLQILADHAGKINSLSFGMIGNRLLLASASDDQTVVVYVVVYDETQDPSGSIFLKLEDFNSPVINAFFDGTTLITIDSTNRAISWELDPQQWVKAACDVVKSEIKPDDKDENWKSFIKNLQGQSQKELCIP